MNVECCTIHEELKDPFAEHSADFALPGARRNEDARAREENLATRKGMDH